MKNQNDLKRELIRIDGKGYKAYKDLEGQYDFKDYILSIDHVQGDPFAAPSRVRVIVLMFLVILYFHLYQIIHQRNRIFFLLHHST